MFKNYFLIAIRILQRNKLFSFINIGGLSLGFTACLLVALFVRSEVSYESWLPDAERIFRLETSQHEPGKPTQELALSPAPAITALAQENPNLVEAYTRLLRRQFWVGYDEMTLEETLNFVDAGFFDVFDLTIVAGNREQLFDDYQSIIISEAAARRYFGETSPLGKTVVLNNGDIAAEVVAIMKDLPSNSHLSLDFIINLDEARFDNQPRFLKWWMSSNVYSYLKLESVAARDAVESILPHLIDQHAPSSPGIAFTEGLLPSQQLNIELMPVQDIHLHSTGRGQMKPGGDIMVVYSFSIIAVLILLIAVINFANLSTARASLRAREIALRKTVGASRKQIVMQLLGETLLTSAIALVIAMSLTELALPTFNELLVTLLNTESFKDPIVQAGLIGLIVVFAIGAGAHPAFSLSSFQPAEVLHSGNAARHVTSRARAFLTTLQFAIAIGLMISTAVIYSQLDHVRTMDMGFDKNGKLTLFHMTYKDTALVASTVQREIAALPEVISTSFTSRSFPIRGKWSLPARVQGMQTQTNGLRLEYIQGDHNMLPFFGAKLREGRFFADERGTDVLQPAISNDDFASQAGILNETAVRQLGFDSAADAIGQSIELTQPDGGIIETEIIGTIADMNLRSAREQAEPMIFVAREGPLWILNAQVEPGSEETVLKKVDDLWSKLVPGVPLDQSYTEDRFAQNYQAEERRGRIFSYFTALAILVSCLGLYGLASFTAERRIKEIGIRKVMGANVADVVRLLTLQFSKPVLLANLMAWPIAWFVTSNWLQGFEYRIDLSPLYFLAAGGAALLIACLTVAGHAIKTARANPVLALKHE